MGAVVIKSPPLRRTQAECSQTPTVRSAPFSPHKSRSVRGAATCSAAALPHPTPERPLQSSFSQSWCHPQPPDPFASAVMRHAGIVRLTSSHGGAFTRRPDLSQPEQFHQRHKQQQPRRLGQRHGHQQCRHRDDAPARVGEETFEEGEPHSVRVC